MYCANFDIECHLYLLAALIAGNWPRATLLLDSLEAGHRQSGEAKLGLDWSCKPPNLIMPLGQPFNLFGHLCYLQILRRQLRDGMQIAVACTSAALKQRTQ